METQTYQYFVKQSSILCSYLLTPVSLRIVTLTTDQHHWVPVTSNALLAAAVFYTECKTVQLCIRKPLFQRNITCNISDSSNYFNANPWYYKTHNHASAFLMAQSDYV
jgi:hypothetical protein